MIPACGSDQLGRDCGRGPRLFLLESPMAMHWLLLVPLYISRATRGTKRMVRQQPRIEVWRAGGVGPATRDPFQRFRRPAEHERRPCSSLSVGLIPAAVPGDGKRGAGKGGAQQLNQRKAWTGGGGLAIVEGGGRTRRPHLCSILVGGKGGFVMSSGSYLAASSNRQYNL